jgi:hypothetical protein
MKVAAQNLSIIERKETRIFSSYVLLLVKNDVKKTVVDSLRIFVPFQNIHMLSYDIFNGEVFVAYESNGTNRITRGTTVTLLRYDLKENKFALNDIVTFAKGANPRIRGITFSIDKNHLKLTNKKQKIKIVYDLLLNLKYLNLVKNVIKDSTIAQVP